MMLKRMCFSLTFFLVLGTLSISCASRSKIDQSKSLGENQNEDGDDNNELIIDCSGTVKDDKSAFTYKQTQVVGDNVCVIFPSKQEQCEIKANQDKWTWNDSLKSCAPKEKDTSAALTCGKDLYPYNGACLDCSKILSFVRCDANSSHACCVKKDEDSANLDCSGTVKDDKSAFTYKQAQVVGDNVCIVFPSKQEQCETKTNQGNWVWDDTLKSCTPKPQVIACNQDFYLDDGKCVSCSKILSTAKCEGNSLRSCGDNNYYISQSGKSCSQCKDVKNAGTCNGINVTACNKGYMIDSDGKTCSGCVLNSNQVCVPETMIDKSGITNPALITGQMIKTIDQNSEPFCRFFIIQGKFCLWRVDYDFYSSNCDFESLFYSKESYAEVELGEKDITITQGTHKKTTSYPNQALGFKNPFFEVKLINDIGDVGCNVYIRDSTKSLLFMKSRVGDYD